MTESRENRRSRTKWDARRIAVAVVALLMALLMVVPLVMNMMLYSHAITQADIDALRQQKRDLANQQAEAQRILDDLTQQENSAMERLDAIENQIGLLSDQINATQDIIDDYDNLIAQTQDELAQAQADEAIYYEQFLERVRVMEEEGQVSYWEILFQSSSFSDLLDRISFVNDVMKYDNDMMDNLEAARIAVNEAEERLEQEQAEQEDAKKQLEQERTELEQAAEAENTVLEEVLANEELYAEQIASLSVREEQLAGEINAAEAELAAQRALEEQRRREEEERQRQEEAARQEALRLQQEEEERRRQEEEERQRQEDQDDPIEDDDPILDDDPIMDDDPVEDDPEPVDPEPEKPVDDGGKNPPGSISGSTLVGFASQYVGKLKYVWGGTSLETGADCSGFVSAVLRHYGLLSGRLTSGSFRSYGKAVSVENMQVGDIVCYSGHVGFYAGNGLLLSAIGTGKGIGYMSVYYKPILAVRRA